MNICSCSLSLIEYLICKVQNLQPPLYLFFMKESERLYNNLHENHSLLLVGDILPDPRADLGCFFFLLGDWLLTGFSSYIQTFILSKESLKLLRFSAI